MNNEEKYKMISEGETALFSDIAVIPRNISFIFDTQSIKASLEKAPGFKLTSFKEEVVDKDTSKAISEYTIEVEYEDENFEIELGVFSNDILSLNDYAFGNAIDNEDLEIAKNQDYHINTRMFFKDDALMSFHLQLKVLHAIVPDASLCIDFMPSRLLSPQWLSMTARSQTPPSPDYLYAMHAVYDDKSGERIYWLHTHGLHRCGFVEVEMVNIKQGANEMYTLLNMIANKMLTDPTKEKERFMIGYDGMGIDVCWLRWEEALTDFSDDIVGGLKERREVGDIHSEPTGVIFAVEDGNMVSPEIYAKTLADNPIYYISTEETSRMSALAKERFVMFKQVYESKQNKESKSFLGKLFKPKSAEEDENAKWGFIVKLGLAVDDPQAGSEREHLWFQVLGIDSANNIKGKLMNEPYWIAGLKQDDVNTYPFELLTDWIIYAPDTSYNSDTIYKLGFQ